MSPVVHEHVITVRDYSPDYRSKSHNLRYSAMVSVSSLVSEMSATLGSLVDDLNGLYAAVNQSSLTTYSSCLVWWYITCRTLVIHRALVVLRAYTSS